MKAKQPKISDEQKAFERWYCKNHFCSMADLKLERAERGYRSPYINGAWRGWEGKASTLGVR
jgi:hypothetical protein